MKEPRGAGKVTVPAAACGLVSPDKGELGSRGFGTKQQRGEPCSLAARMGAACCGVLGAKALCAAPGCRE